MERLIEKSRNGNGLVRRDLNTGGHTTPCGLSADKLQNYTQAVREGLPCYVAAEISSITGKEVQFVVGDNKTYGGYYNAPLEKGKAYDVWFGVAVTVDGVRFIRRCGDSGGRLSPEAN